MKADRDKDRSDSARNRVPVRRLLIAAAVLALLLAAWSVFGFYYVPVLVKHNLPRLAEEKLQHTARLGEVRFNPFTLRASIRDFVLEDSTGQRVLGFESLEIVPRWSSLLRRGAVFSEIRLASPYVNVVVDREGRLNLARLVPKSDAQPAPDRPKSLPLVDIGLLDIDKGRIAFEDQRQGYRDSVDNIALSLKNLSTVPNDEGDDSLSAQTSDGAKLRLSGKMSVNPLLATGSLSVQDLSLAKFNPYLASLKAGALASGVAAATLPYRLELPGGEPRLVVSQAKLGVRDLGYGLAGSQGGSPQTAVPPQPSKPAQGPLLRLAQIAVDGIDFDWNTRRAAASSITLGNAAMAAGGGPGEEGPVVRVAQLKLQSASVDLTSTKLSVSAVNVGDVQLFQSPTASAPQAKLARIDLQDVSVDPGARRVAVSALDLADGQLALSRDANGDIELPGMPGAKASTSARDGVGAAATTPSTAPADRGKVKAESAQAADGTAAKPWSASIDAIDVHDVSATYRDATAKTPLVLAVEGFAARGKLEVTPGDKGMQARLDGGELQLRRFTAGDGAGVGTAGATPAFALGDLAVSGVSLDQAANTLNLGRIGVGTVRVSAALRDGRISLLDMLPQFKSDPDSKPLAYAIGAVELHDGRVNVTDLDHQMNVAVERIHAKGTGVVSDRTKPLRFNVTAQANIGGNLALSGSLVPASGMLDATVKADGLGLAGLQAFLSRLAAVRLASGVVGLDGRFQGALLPPTQMAPGTTAKTQARAQRAAGSTSATSEAHAAPSIPRAERPLTYRGDITVSNASLTDEQGGPLMAWQSLVAHDTRVLFNPLRVDIDEVRLTGPMGRFALAKDGTTNISHLLKTEGAPGLAAVPAGNSKGNTASAPPPAPQPQAAGAPPIAQPPAAPPVEVSVRQVTVAQGTLEYADANIEPGFSATITGLTGSAASLSTARDTRTQFTLEGNVGEFGFARLTGGVNVYAPRDNTEFRVEMRNIDMTQVTPYSMRFAGYRIASGRLNLDLNYHVRDAALQGDNRIVLEQFTLGEKVESPRALDLPLRLAVSLLKDPDGTINVELPVRGSLDDPQFSVAPLVWKALGNLLLKIVSAPFRAMGHLFGGADQAEQAGSIMFEPGRSRLLPPEREKLQKVAGVMNQKQELQLAVPAHFDEAADTRALKSQALAREVAGRAGIAVAAGDEAPPINIEDRRTRGALRDLFTERFSATEYDKLVAAAEAKGKAAGGSAPERSATGRPAAGQAGSPGAGSGSTQQNAATRDESAKEDATDDRAADDALIAPANAGTAGGNASQPGIFSRTLESARRAVANEPQATDLRGFYGDIARRLRDAEQVTPEMLQKLGRDRAQAIADDLRAAGLAANRVETQAPAAPTPGGEARLERTRPASGPEPRLVKVDLVLAATR
jgi:hypothetical protein